MPIEVHLVNPKAKEGDLVPWSEHYKLVLSGVQQPPDAEISEVILTKISNRIIDFRTGGTHTEKRNKQRVGLLPTSKERE